MFAGMLSIVIVPRLLSTPIAGAGEDRWDTGLPRVFRLFAVGCGVSTTLNGGQPEEVRP